MLELIDLSLKRNQQLLFSHVNLNLFPGQLLLVTGDNGSGKSSLLRLVAGFFSPETGNINWQGQAIQQDITTYRNTLHYIGHTDGIKLGLTVTENIKLMTCLHEPYAVLPTDDQQVDLIKQFSLKNEASRLAGHLSTGQKRRLALLKLFLFPKKIWILDEPLNSLDNKIQIIFLEKLTQHLTQGGLVIMSSHQVLSLPTIFIHSLRLSVC